MERARSDLGLAATAAHPGATVPVVHLEASAGLDPGAPRTAEAPGEAFLNDFAKAGLHPTPPFWANPHADAIDHLLKEAPRGAMAEKATHEAIHAGGRAVQTGLKTDHDDAKALHREAAEAHRSFCRNFNPATAQHSNQLADLHDLAAAWHGERGSVLAKPEDFLTPAGTDAFYVRAFGESHPPQRLETDQQLAGTHEVRDGQHKPKVPEELRELHRLEARVIRKEHMRPGNPQGNPHSSAAWDFSSEGDDRNAQEAHEIAGGHYKCMAKAYEALGQTQDAMSAFEGVEVHDRVAKWHGDRLVPQQPAAQDPAPTTMEGHS